MVSLPFDATEIVAAWAWPTHVYPVPIGEALVGAKKNVSGVNSRPTPERVAMPILTLSGALDMPDWLAQAQPALVG